MATIAYSAYRLLALGFRPAKAPVSSFKLSLALALVFGLVHGLGFSSVLASMVVPGQGVLPLLVPFALGIEVAQAWVAVLVLIWLKLSVRQGIPYYILVRAAGLVVAGGVAWAIVLLVI